LAILASYAAAVALMAPSETIAFAKSSLAALFSVANVFFYATSGYFGPRAIDLPLLHLWSLGIEEQFYIVFPLIAVVLSKYFRRAVVPVLAVLGLLSLLWSQGGLSCHPEASFYLLQSRAFELTIGVLLARLSGKLELRAAQLMSAIGAASLIAAMFLYSDKTRFPGLAALVPCLGTALIIWSGQAGTVLSRILAVPPLVYVGKISYPLYLAHWPLIVFGRRCDLSSDRKADQDRCIHTYKGLDPGNCRLRFNGWGCCGPFGKRLRRAPMASDRRSYPFRTPRSEGTVSLRHLFSRPGSEPFQLCASGLLSRQAA
jgi:peptidoglycan/LPS O-acetylase OafA/YrhL